MNILINLSTLKQGGGQNVGLNFLQFLFDNYSPHHGFYFMVSKGSSIQLFLESKKVKGLIITPRNPVLRIIYEILFNKKKIRNNHINIVYTYFGYGIFPITIPQVCGVAFSNVFYPEIDFWSEYRGIKLILRQITDKYRIWGLKRASGLIFENKIMEIRSHIIYSIPSRKTIFIPPSLNNRFPDLDFELPIEVQQNKVKVLILSGWHRNKNIHKIPFIANEIKRKNKDVHFILAAQRNNSIDCMEFIRLMKKLNVMNCISIIGTVRKEHLASLYAQIDMVLLLSKLESFSNNIIESWFFHKPLIISDAEWSKSICNDAALYVNRENPEMIANEILNLSTNPLLCQTLITNGEKEMNNYPSICQRGQSEIAFLEKIYNDF